MRKVCPGRPNDRTPGDSGDWRQTGGSRGHHDRRAHAVTPLCRAQFFMSGKKKKSTVAGAPRRTLVMNLPEAEVEERRADGSPDPKRRRQHGDYWVPMNEFYYHYPEASVIDFDDVVWRGISYHNLLRKVEDEDVINEDTTYCFTNIEPDGDDGPGVTIFKESSMQDDHVVEVLGDSYLGEKVQLMLFGRIRARLYRYPTDDELNAMLMIVNGPQPRPPSVPSFAV